jgi:DNA-binding NtrC family response regulator
VSGARTFRTSYAISSSSSARPGGDRRADTDPRRLGAAALARLPGNVRELQNLIEGAASLAEGTIDADLLRSLLGGSAAAASGPEPLDLAAVERRHIQRVLELARGNKSSAARLLGIDRRTLLRKGY